MNHFQYIAIGVFLLILAAGCFVGGASDMIGTLQAVHRQSEPVAVFSGGLPMLLISPVIGLISIAFLVRKSPRTERWVVVLLPWIMGMLIVSLLSGLFVPVQWYVAHHGYSRCPGLAFMGTRTFTTVWYKDNVSLCAPSVAP